MNNLALGSNPRSVSHQRLSDNIIPIKSTYKKTKKTYTWRIGFNPKP